MAEHILMGIVAVLVLGITAQWLAWRFKVPSILLLLIFGFVAGPVTGSALLDPDMLQGQWLFSFVSLSIGIILFEGGLSLRVKDLREVGKAVLNLITIGVLVTWVLVSVAAYFILGFNVGLSVLLGALLTVTGPTVVVPLLRQVRPTGRIGTVAKWEGITVDPVGAILAVLVLETIIILHESVAVAAGGGHGLGEALSHAAQGLLLTIFISVGISVLAAALLVVLLHRRLVPDYLQSSVALMVVVSTFAMSNMLQEESGLLEATLLGIFMANQRYVPVRRISEFKEDLQVLLIGSLFILLSARLQPTALEEIGTSTFIFLGVLILAVRPIAVMLSSLGTPLDWREQTFLAWLAPRGIVAAAVASLFAYRLDQTGIYGALVDQFVPVVFFVIVGTVAVYGLTISPLARWLGLAEPNAQGVLILGAHPWAQQLGKALHQLGVKVLLVDSNARNIERARQGGLPAEAANALSEAVIDELELAGIGRLLALTPNDEVNSLAALHFSEIFESTEVYQLAARPGSRPAEAEHELPRHLRGRPLFGESTTHLSLTERFNGDDEVQIFDLDEEQTWESLQERYHHEAVLLFVKRGDDLLIHAEEDQLAPQPGDTVVALVPPTTEHRGVRQETLFERLVTQAHVIEVGETATYEEIAHRAASILAEERHVTTEAVEHGFIESTRMSEIPVTHGAALPHLRMPNIDEPMLVLVRCATGTCIEYADRDGEQPDQSEEIYAFLFLLSNQDNPGEHLRILANIASRIDEVQFLSEWRMAEDEQQLKETLLHDDRYLSLRLGESRPAASWIGRRVGELDLPRGNHVALLRRDGEVTIPDDATVLRDGDRLTIIGDVSGIDYLTKAYVLGAGEEEPVE